MSIEQRRSTHSPKAGCPRTVKLYSPAGCGDVSDGGTRGDSFPRVLFRWRPLWTTISGMFCAVGHGAHSAMRAVGLGRPTAVIWEEPADIGGGCT